MTTSNDVLAPASRIHHLQIRGVEHRGVHLEFPGCTPVWKAEACFVEHGHEFADDHVRTQENLSLPNIRKKFGARITGLRDERNWTQEDLAAASGVSTRSISSIENGVYSVTLDTAYKLARALGLPLAELFDF